MEMILEMFHLQMTRSNWYGRTQWRHRRSQLYSWLSGAAFPTFQDKFIVCIIRPFVCLFYSEIVLVYGNWLDQVWRLSKRLKFFDFNRKSCFNRINQQLFKAMTLLSRKRFLSGWENPLNLLVGFVRRRKTLNGRLIFFLEDASSRAECIDQSSTEMTLTADKICSFPLDKKKRWKHLRPTRAISDALAKVVRQLNRLLGRQTQETVIVSPYITTRRPDTALKAYNVW